MTVRMELSRVLIQEVKGMQLIELREVGGQRTFPIVIGLSEAFAIQRRWKGQTLVRPQTHDLLASTIRALDGKLLRIVINDLSDGTFYAKIMVLHGGQEVAIDSRPSDAIAIGAAEDVPIFVEEHVLEETQKDGVDFQIDFELDDNNDDDELSW